MNKKTAKKKKAPKISPEEQLAILQRDAEAKWQAEQVALQEKDTLELKEYNQRRVILVDTNKFFRKLEKTAAETYRKLARNQDWEHYLSCKKTPDPTNAAELRDFLYQWTYELEQQTKNFTSWTLNVNERSTLTQDDTVPNATWQCLCDENKDAVGSSFLPGIRNALHILALIEDSALKSFPQKEVVKVRDEIRAKVAQVLDEITMRVGGNIWRDMIPMDPIKAEFMFTSDIINFYLWSFQHVPLPPECNYLVKVIEMRSLSITFQKPPSFDLKDCSVRGIWTQFDHFSDLDPSIRCPISETIPDLIASQEMEWVERNRLKAQKLQEMKSSRERYEEEQKKKELEELEAAKGKPKYFFEIYELLYLPFSSSKSKYCILPHKKEFSTTARSKAPLSFSSATSKKESKKSTSKKTVKKKKSKDRPEIKPPEAPPPVVTDQTTIDIDELYVLQECQNYERKMEQIGPNSLNISNDYVNLRRYIINGGVFAIQRFVKLPQPCELRADFIYSSLPKDLKLTEKKFKCEEDTDLMVFKFTLPEQYFWWHSPLVCRWEIWEESDEFHSLNEELQRFHLDYDKIIEEKSKQLFSAPKLSKQLMKPTIISDFPITDIPSEVNFHFLIKDHVLPRIPQRFKFHAEMHRQFSIIQGLFMRGQRQEMEEKLNDLLNLTFQKLKTSGQSLEEQEEAFRVPSISDIPAGKESMASLDGSLVDSEIQTPVTPMLEKLIEAQYSPAYLFPPRRKIPFLIITEKQQLEPSDLELDEMMQDILESVISEDDFSSEAVYKLFSTFIKFLDRLRELEQPVFSDVIEPEEPEVDPTVAPVDTSRKKSRESTHRHSSWTDLRSARTSRMLSSLATARAQRPQSRSSVKLARKKRKRRKSTALQSASDASTDEEREPKAADLIELEKLTHPAGRWTTRGIHKQEYDPATRTVTIWTENLGTFGFAMKRYYNLPFKAWNMRRVGKLSDLTTSLTLDCIGLQLVINITKSGYTVHFQSPVQDITPPSLELSLDELIKYLTKINLNVFPDVDAPFYVAKMTTPKHESMEIHSMKNMAAFCLTHNFTNSFWNKYAPFREALFQSRQVIEGCPEQAFVTVVVKPVEAAVVTVEELCSPLEQVFLAYHPTQQNQTYYPDVYSLLKDNLEEPSRKLFSKTPPMLQWNVAQILQKLRLFSYS